MQQDCKKSGQAYCGRNKMDLRHLRGVRKSVLWLRLGESLAGLGLVISALQYSKIDLLAVCGVKDAQAAICFLPDCPDKVEEFHGDANTSAKYCRDMGYVYYELGQCPQYHKTYVCPDNTRYLKCDAAEWCEDNGYNTFQGDCKVPTYVDEQCPNGLERYKQCKTDYLRACLEENSNYVSSCQSGWQLDNNKLCSYSPLYGLCCNLCSGYPYLEKDIPNGYVKDESCEACGGETKYSVVANPCDGYQRCPDGHKSGTAECQHGDETWYKECCAYECDLESCPVGTECSYEACSNRYCITGCSINYSDYCERPVENCWELGYQSTSCSGDKLICPYDTTKFFCI